MPPSVSSVVSSIPSSQSRAQGRIVAMSGQMTYQGAPQHNQINRTSPTPPLHSLQRIPAQNRSQPPAQQEVQCPGSDSQASSPPKIQGNRRGSFLYGGTQVMGATRNVGVGHGDQSFPGTTFFLARYSFVFFGSHILSSKRVTKKNNFIAFHYACVRDAHANALASHFFLISHVVSYLLSLLFRVFGIFLLLLLLLLLLLC